MKKFDAIEINKAKKIAGIWFGVTAACAFVISILVYFSQDLLHRPEKVFTSLFAMLFATTLLSGFLMGYFFFYRLLFINNKRFPVVKVVMLALVGGVLATFLAVIMIITLVYFGEMFSCFWRVSGFSHCVSIPNLELIFIMPFIPFVFVMYAAWIPIFAVSLVSSFLLYYRRKRYFK